MAKKALRLGAHVAFKCAWPTATFTRYEYKGMSFPKYDRANKELSFNVTTRLYGKSNWTGNTIWVDGVITVGVNRNDIMRVKDAKWGSYDALWPPGATLQLIGKVLE